MWDRGKVVETRGEEGGFWDMVGLELRDLVVVEGRKVMQELRWPVWSENLEVRECGCRGEVMGKREDSQEGGKRGLRQFNGERNWVRERPRRTRGCMEGGKRSRYRVGKEGEGVGRWERG